MSTELTEEELFADAYDGQGETPKDIDAELDEIQARDTSDSVPEPVAEATPVGAEPVEVTPPVAEPAAETPPVEAAPTADDQPNVPSWRLREVTEARIAAEAARDAAAQEAANMRHQMAMMQQQIAQQPQPEAPDMFENPEGYKQHQDAQLQQVITDIRHQNARTEAALHYNVQTRDEAWAAAVAAEATTPGLTQRIKSAPNPWVEAIQWHQQSQMAQATGGDINKYNETYEAKLLSDPTFLQKAQAKLSEISGGQVVQETNTIPSLNGAASANRQTAKQASTDQELFDM